MALLFFKDPFSPVCTSRFSHECKDSRKEPQTCSLVQATGEISRLETWLVRIEQLSLRKSPKRRDYNYPNGHGDLTLNKELEDKVFLLESTSDLLDDISFLGFYLLLFRDWGRGGEKGENHPPVRETSISCLSHAPPLLSS